MIYLLIRTYVGFILKFFIKKITLINTQNLPANGPVLVCGNHPNSFLDGIIIACMMKRPVWSMARGDAFKKPLANKLLGYCYMMPIYRLSEGKEYLEKNNESFARGIELLSQNQQITIFSEGICTNQTQLLPLKKGTARIAQQAWNANLPLQILPTVINYDSYTKFGKLINLSFGETFNNSEFEDINNDGTFFKNFNEKLKNSLIPLFNTSYKSYNFFENPLYYIGWILNFPLYLILIPIIKKITNKTVFYDSVLLGSMVFLLPIYWLILCTCLSIFI